MELSNKRFAALHQAFLDLAAKESGGRAFAGFDHPFLVRTEIQYKWQVYGQAREVLQVERWPMWIHSPGTIRRAVTEACDSQVARNLLIQRYGKEHSPQRALYAAAERSGSEDGFDISSFHDDGTPRHIEVKTTMRRRGDDVGFWLSERERACAINDRHWSVVRVWSIDVQPSLEDIGNPISESASPWSVEPSSWFVRHERTDKAR